MPSSISASGTTISEHRKVRLVHSEGYSEEEKRGPARLSGAMPGLIQRAKVSLQHLLGS